MMKDAMNTNLSQITNKLDLGMTFCRYIRTEEFDPVIMCSTIVTDGLFVYHEPMLAGVSVWGVICHGEVVVCFKIMSHDGPTLQ
jgi:hypothetical protein